MLLLQNMLGTIQRRSERDCTWHSPGKVDSESRANSLSRCFAPKDWQRRGCKEIDKLVHLGQSPLTWLSSSPPSILLWCFREIEFPSTGDAFHLAVTALALLPKRLKLNCPWRLIVSLNEWIETTSSGAITRIFTFASDYMMWDSMERKMGEVTSRNNYVLSESFPGTVEILLSSLSLDTCPLRSTYLAVDEQMDQTSNTVPWNTQYCHITRVQWTTR